MSIRQRIWFSFEFADHVSNTHTPQEIKKQEQQCREAGEDTFVGMTVLEAARVLKLSPLLTNEQLGSAERNGALCRDVTLEGTRYFRNIFV